MPEGPCNTSSVPCLCGHLHSYLHQFLSHQLHWLLPLDSKPQLRKNYPSSTCCLPDFANMLSNSGTIFFSFLGRQITYITSYMTAVFWSALVHCLYKPEWTHPHLCYAAKLLTQSMVLRTMGGRLTGETHKGTFGGDERDLYLVSDGGYTNVCNCQNSWTVCLLMFVDYNSTELTESNRTLILDKEGHRALSPHSLWVYSGSRSGHGLYKRCWH